MKSDVAGILHELRKQGKRVLFEGAQGSLLDIDHGTYPYVTLLQGKRRRAKAIAVHQSGLPDRADQYIRSAADELGIARMDVGLSHGRSLFQKQRRHRLANNIRTANDNSMTTRKVGNH